MFKKFFGTNPDKIKQNCVICPGNDMPLFDNEHSTDKTKGLFFKTVNSGFATVISTHNNFLIADCALLLKETACENIFLFGPCGALRPAKIGDETIIKKAFNFESASSILETSSTPKAHYPNKSLFENFSSFSQIKSGVCATIGSLILERENIAKFRDLKIEYLDMEASAIFSCAASIDKNAIAIFYAADIREKERLLTELTEKEKRALKCSRKKLAANIIEFIKNQ